LRLGEVEAPAGHLGQLGGLPERVAAEPAHDQIWPEHADGIGRYFVQPLAQRDLGELGRILDTLILANEEEPG